MSIRNMDALFQPQSIAVFGASDRPASVGAVVMRNLRGGGFKGPIWPVNPNHEEVGGERAWPDVASLPGVPDLAVICTPPAAVPGLIAQLGQAGTRGAIVMTAGLRAQPADGGPTLEQAMLDAARPWLLRILGPNCLGALVPSCGLNASFAPANALPGGIAFITQSGALATGMLDWATGRGIGFSHFISLGDVADVDFGDVLDYLSSDPGTRAILMYMESVTSSRKFMSAARAASRNKPVIVVKAGRAPEGARAAASHTGALAGSDAVFDAAVRRAGMLRVDTLEDLFDAAETLSHRQPWRGDRLAILTNGGGAGVLAADSLSLGGGTLARLEPATLEALDACLPATWSHGDPVDIIGDAPVARYADALAVLMAAPEVDGVLFMHAPTAIVPAPDIAIACLPQIKPRTKPILASWLGGASVAAAADMFSAAGVPCYVTPEHAVTAWLQLARHAHNQQALDQVPGAEPDAAACDAAAAREALEEARAQGREWLDPVQAQRVLQAYGIPVLEAQMAFNVDHAVSLAHHIGYPVALKIVSQKIVHKSDVGGVAMGLKSGDEVRAAAIRMRVDAARLAPHAPVQGFIVQAMASRPDASELIAGIATDAAFGPVLLFGEGGTSVEQHKRHAIGLPPLNTTLARDLAGQAGVAHLLASWRGKPGVDMAAVDATLVRLSQLACDQPLVAELDINPLLADAHGVLALDARIRLRPVGAPASLPAIRPYPAVLEEAVLLGGERLRVRPIRPGDAQRLAAFYAGASPGDMRLRFFSMRREVPHSELARYSQIDYDREMTFIALAHQPDGGEAIAAEVRAVCDPDNHCAEFAIQVGGAWQGRGLGRLMLDKLLRYLRAHGTDWVEGQCLQENVVMAALARSAGFELTTSPDGDTQRMRLALREAARAG